MPSVIVVVTVVVMAEVLAGKIVLFDVVVTEDMPCSRRRGVM
jgi:hypothetical protein